MSANWPINLLIIAGILVIINNILHFSYNREKIAGGRLFFLILIILLTLGAVFGNYYIQMPESKIANQEYTAILTRNVRLLKTNDSLNILISEIGRQHNQMRKTLSSMSEIALKKYPELSPEDALERLAGNLEEMEKTINDMRPRLIYLGDSARLAESRGENFYFTTYYFRAKGAAVRDLTIKFGFSGYIGSVTGRIFSGTQALEKGRIKLKHDSKGFVYKLDLLPLESDLRLTVKSRDWLTVKSKEWSPR
jgi:hypothetical protein